MSFTYIGIDSIEAPCTEVFYIYDGKLVFVSPAPAVIITPFGIVNHGWEYDSGTGIEDYELTPINCGVR